MAVVAQQAIKAGSFISIDYTPGKEEVFDFLLLCLCGSPECHTRQAYIDFVNKNPPLPVITYNPASLMWAQNLLRK